VVSSGDVDRAVWALRAYETIALATVSASGPHVAAFFFAPEGFAGGVRLVIAMARDSRVHREITADPRVAFMCYPGNATRWITGRGVAQPEGDGAEALLEARLLAHAPGARAFVDSASVVSVIVEARRLEIVQALDTPPWVLDFEG